MKRKYTSEKRVFIVGGIGALVLRCAPPGRTAAPVLLIFSAFPLKDGTRATSAQTARKAGRAVGGRTAWPGCGTPSAGQRGSHWNATFGSLSRPPAAVGAAASAGIPMGLPSPANRWPWPGDVPAGPSPETTVRPVATRPAGECPGGYAPAEPAAQRLARRGVPATHSSARAARRRPRAALRPTSTRRRIAAHERAGRHRADPGHLPVHVPGGGGLAAAFFRFFTPCPGRLPRADHLVRAGHGARVRPGDHTRLQFLPAAGAAVRARHAAHDPARW